MRFSLFLYVSVSVFSLAIPIFCHNPFCHLILIRHYTSAHRSPFHQSASRVPSGRETERQTAASNNRICPHSPSLAASSILFSAPRPYLIHPATVTSVTSITITISTTITAAATATITTSSPSRLTPSLDRLVVILFSSLMLKLFFWLHIMPFFFLVYLLIVVPVMIVLFCWSLVHIFHFLVCYYYMLHFIDSLLFAYIFFCRFYFIIYFIHISPFMLFVFMICIFLFSFGSSFVSSVIDVIFIWSQYSFVCYFSPCRIYFFFFILLHFLSFHTFFTRISSLSSFSFYWFPFFQASFSIQVYFISYIYSFFCPAFSPPSTTPTAATTPPGLSIHTIDTMDCDK